MSGAASFRLLSLRLGQVQAFGPVEQVSAIAKIPVNSRIELGKQGLAGDEHADTRHHGGIDKALHHYPFEHYAAWARELPTQAALFVAGGFGENLSTQGLDETNVCLGDVFRIGSATIQVSQGRTPCGKLNHRFDVADMVQRVQASGRTGWYYRVLSEGRISLEDQLQLIERSQPAWPLARVFKVLIQNPADPDHEALAELASSKVLSANWRERAIQANQRLLDNQAKSWLRRWFAARS